MLFQSSPSKVTLSEAALRCSKNLFIKSYSEFIKKHPCRRIISEKVAWKTEFETVSEQFCLEDSYLTSQLFKEKVPVMLEIYYNSLLFIFYSLQTRVLITNYLKPHVGSCQNYL